MNILNWINQGIDNLTNISGPGMDALGFHIFVALLTTMMVWFGVQEALSSAQGGPGFNFARFVDFVVVASFAYTFIEFYEQRNPRRRLFIQRLHQCWRERSCQHHRPRWDRPDVSDDCRHAKPARGRNR